MEATSTGGLFRNLLPWTKRDAEEAAKRRDAGMKQVVSNSSEWAEKCRPLAEAALRELAPGTTFIGEDLRVKCLERGLEPPAHPNAWGGVIGGVIRAALKSGRVEIAGMNLGIDGAVAPPGLRSVPQGVVMKEGTQPVASVGWFEYAPDGRVLATIPRGGITLLDQFALAAMQPLLEEDKLSNAEVAHHAYNIAEAMVAERESRYARLKG